MIIPSDPRSFIALLSTICLLTYPHTDTVYTDIRRCNSNLANVSSLPVPHNFHSESGEPSTSALLLITATQV